MIKEVIIDGLVSEDARSLVGKLLSYMGIHGDIRESEEYTDYLSVHVYNVSEEECAKIRVLTDCIKAQRISVKGTRVAGKLICDVSRTIAADIVLPGIANAVKYGYRSGETLKSFKDKIKNNPLEGGKIKNRFKLPFKVTIERT